MNNKKIKVVIGINDFLVGGAQKHLVEQFKFFDKEKFEFYLVVLFQFNDKNNFYYLLSDDIVVHKLNFNSFFDLRSWIKLIKLLKQIKPDIVMSSLFFSNTIFRILKLFFGYIVISREHNTYIWKPRLQIFIDRILSLVSYKIVAVSQTVADFISKNENIRKDKFIVIHNSVNLDEIKKIKEKYNKDELKKEFGFNKEDKIIINAGRLTYQKNHKLLIDAFSKFVKSNNCYKLIILGEGSLRNNLEDQIKKLNLNNNILLMGVKKDIYKYYIISDFFASVSRIEGLSNAYLEAMSFGLPLLSTKTAGTDEIIIDGINGYFINKSDKIEVIKGLQKISKSDLNFMGNKAVELCQRFNIKDNVKKYENLFNDSLNIIN